MIEVDDTRRGCRRRRSSSSPTRRRRQLTESRSSRSREHSRSTLDGAAVGTVRMAGERNPLAIELRLPRSIRSSTQDLSGIRIKGRTGHQVALAEIGRWETKTGGSDDLPQEPGTRRLCLRRNRGSPASGVRPRRDLRPPSWSESGCQGWVADTKPRPLELANLLPERRRHRLVRSRGHAGRVRRRGRVEDHHRRIPRPWPGLRRGHADDLRHPRRPDELVPRPARRHARHSL